MQSSGCTCYRAFNHRNVNTSKTRSDEAGRPTSLFAPEKVPAAFAGVGAKTPPASRANPAARMQTSLLVRARTTADSMRAGAAWNGDTISHAGVARCLQFLRRNWQVRFKLRDLERVAGLKRRGLHRAFVAHLGCTPGVVLRLVRLERACGLLVQSDLPVGEVARRCGYRSANSLWVMFARDLGVSPARFRARQKAGAAGPAQPSEHSRTAAVPGSHHCDAMLPVSHGSSWVDPVQQPSPHNGRRFGPHHLASRHRGAVPDISRGLNPQSG
jgi:AraC-like DNA-binding protein